MTPQLDYATMSAIFGRFQQLASRAEGRIAAYQCLHPAGRRGAVGAGDRCGGEQGDQGAVRAWPTRLQRCWRLGEERLIEHIKTIGLYRNKARNVIKLSQHPDRGLWRSGAVVPRCLAVAAGGRAQDRQCGVEHVVSPCRRRRSTPISFASATAPALRPARMKSAVERAIEDNVPVEYQTPRPPLADPAWPLHLHSRASPDAAIA